MAVKQGGSSVNALLWALILYGNNIAVSVRLNACVRQTPFQNGIIVINNPVCLQVCVGLLFLLRGRTQELHTKDLLILRKR